MRDSIVTGAVAGIAGGIFYQVFTWVFLFSGIAGNTPSHLGAYIMTRPGSDIGSLPAQALGMVAHFVLAAFIGIIAVYLLRFTGRDSVGKKGLLLGGLTYFFIYGVAAKIVIPVHVLQPDLATSIVHLFGNLFYGLTAVYWAWFFLPERRGAGE